MNVLSMDEVRMAVSGKPIAVLAGNFAQFVDYCRMNNLDYRRGKEAVYVDHPERILGVHVSKVVLYGTWYENREARELYYIAKSQVR